MKESENNDKKPLTVTIIILCVALLLLLVGVLAIFMGNREDPVPETSQATDTSQDTQSQETTEQIPSSYLEISNEYCVMFYPREWEEQLEISEEVVNDTLAEIFYYVFEGEKFRLFTVYFGDAQVGNQLGYLTIGDESVCVNMDCGFLPENVTLEKEQIQTFYKMMDDITTVTESIRNAQNFTEILEP